jgi:hypothetical protein
MNNPLPVYLKRIVALYASETEMKEVGERISMPLLLSLLENKNLTS